MSSPSKTSRRTAILGVASAALLAACGFQPIAAPTALEHAEHPSILLADLDITVIGPSDDDRFGYHMRRYLDRYVSTGVPTAPTLRVRVVVNQREVSITEDDTITRFEFRAQASYTIGEPGGQTPHQGTVRSITGVNATASQFSTSVAERTAHRRIAEDLARQILTVLRLRDAGKLPDPDGGEG